MRTKTMLCAAAALAAGLASSVAQTNVYSLNVVGYYNVTIPAGRFQMIANQLQTTNTTLNSLFGNVPDGTQFYQWTGGGYAVSLFEDPGGGGEWTVNLSVPVGTGGFMKNNTVGSLTVTMLGEVSQGSLTNPIPAGYNIEASIVPQAGAVSSVLGMPAADGDQVFKWTGTGYLPFLYEDPGGGGEWAPSEPTVAVGESFFSRKSAAVNWVRNFTVQ